MKKITQTAILRADWLKDHARKVFPVEVLSKEEFISAYGYDPFSAVNEDGEPNESVTTKVLVIQYKKSDETTWNLNIPDYKSGITDTEITNGARAILAENVFSPDGMDLVQFVKGTLVDTIKTTVLPV